MPARGLMFLVLLAALTLDGLLASFGLMRILPDSPLGE
jgi:hypothetical protein